MPQLNLPAAGPLHGIRVIDFGRFIAGPYCGALLADMGADVIRIDRRQGSEDSCLQALEKMVRERAGGSGAAKLTNPVHIGVGTKRKADRISVSQHMPPRS